jgi:hypothetical protein
MSPRAAFGSWFRSTARTLWDAISRLLAPGGRCWKAGSRSAHPRGRTHPWSRSGLPCAEHLFGEGALLGNQVLGEVEYGVEDLLRVARSVTTGTGPAAHCFHQLVAALAPLFPEVLEVLLGATGQLGELLLWTGHCDLLLDEGTRAPNTLGRKRYPGAAPPTKRGSVTVILGRSPQQSKAPRVHWFSQGEFAESLASAGMPVEAVAGVVSVFQEILDGRNARLTDGVRRALSRPASHFADYGRTAARIEGWA